MPAKHVDLALIPRWTIPMEPEAQVLEGYAVLVDQCRVEAVIPHAEMSQRFVARQIMPLPGHALIPGLVNAHTHAAMVLMRGLADDLPLMTWLQKHIWPVEARFADAAFVRGGTRLAVLEMLRGGTTCFNDMYFFPDTVADVVAACGIRACVGLIAVDFPSAWAADAEEYLKKGEALHKTLAGHPTIHTALAPHAPYTVSDRPLERIAKLAKTLDIPVHMHVHETAHEVNEAQRTGGKRPIDRLDELGLVNHRLIAVHMTQLTDREVEKIAAANASVVHCPESNLKLASGFAPVTALDEAGVNVAIGTDGAASNNDLDMLGEIRIAALLAKAVAGDASALPAHRALRMATLHGARALGLGDRIGSIEVGKDADLVAVRLDVPETEPVFNPLSQLVYSASRHQVTDVWVRGKRLLAEGEPTTLDVTDILAEVRTWRDRLADY